MKSMLDVCVDSLLICRALLDQGHDVLLARDIYPQALDEELLAIALKEGRVLVTEDKDFGELVFLRGHSHPGIVRLCGMTVMERADAMRNLMEHHRQALNGGAIIVVSKEKVRVRFTRPLHRS